jgi:hypothetical protein
VQGDTQLRVLPITLFTWDWTPQISDHQRSWGYKEGPWKGQRSAGGR